MRPDPFVPVVLSLAELLGEEYLEAVCAARAACSGESRESLRLLAARKVDFFPTGFQARLTDLHARVGQPLTTPFTATAPGVTTRAFSAATHIPMAPLSGFGYYRVGENGRLYFISKSEHYHASLGHAFPGYTLLEIARHLGISNATHNNTRGFITRRLEEELVRVANGVPREDAAPGLLNRVLNLETGSLATEAALKMMLARFYAHNEDASTVDCRSRVPVVLVMGNDDGGLHANYHGTTILTQLLRGLWPELYTRLEAANILLVRTLRPNAITDAETLFATYNRPPYKIAGFMHEIVMMNYGARLHDPAFLARVYELCAIHDVPTLVDEIQSGLWHHELFLFREYGLHPTFVAIGKGFPGGEYPASRLLFSEQYDLLPQFGTLVTNGQEEIASLAYLVTMRWAMANAAVTRAVGDYYQQKLSELVAAFPALLCGYHGLRHLCGLSFQDLATAQAFVAAMNARGFDLSAQTYKADCPPVVLTKLPLIAGTEAVDFLIGVMYTVLAEVGSAMATLR